MNSESTSARLASDSEESLANKVIKPVPMTNIPKTRAINEASPGVSNPTSELNVVGKKVNPAPNKNA